MAGLISESKDGTAADGVRANDLPRVVEPLHARARLARRIDGGEAVLTLKRAWRYTVVGAYRHVRVPSLTR